MQQYLKDFEGQIEYDIPLAKCTSWKVGGKAKICYKPKNQMDLSYFLSSLPVSEKLLWLGLGSNTLISDQGFDGIVILTQNAHAQLNLLDNHHVEVEAGIACPTLARFCARASLEGLEFLSAIPGTVGGALATNAGAYGSEIWNFVTQVKTINRHGKIIQRTKKDYSIGYRSVIKPSNEWFVSAKLQLTLGHPKKSLERIHHFLSHRTQTQPREPSAGSVFRNPKPFYAGRLIESCQLKGKRLGNAVISEKHANFITNQGGATSNDIKSLIYLVQCTVLQKKSIFLVPEVHCY